MLTDISISAFWYWAGCDGVDVLYDTLEQAHPNLFANFQRQKFFQRKE